MRLSARGPIYPIACAFALELPRLSGSRTEDGQMYVFGVCICLAFALHKFSEFLRYALTDPRAYRYTASKAVCTICSRTFGSFLPRGLDSRNVAEITNTMILINDRKHH